MPTSEPYGALYLGVTNDFAGRIEAHREGGGSRVTSRYGVGMLVADETFADIVVAIQREAALKHWLRAWRSDLTERDNPHWADLYAALLAPPDNRPD